MYIHTWKRLAPVQGVISGTIQCRRNYISYIAKLMYVITAALYRAIILTNVFAKWIKPIPMFEESENNIPAKYSLCSNRENRLLENCETSRSATREFRLHDRGGEVVRTTVER